MRNTGSGMAIALGLFAVAGALWVLRRDHASPDPPAVLAQVRRLNQLATAQYTIQKVIGLTEEASPVGSESILLIVQVNVQAGIDLEEMSVNDITVRPDKTTVVRLPPAHILGVYLDENQTKVWDRQKTWWTPWVPYSRDLEHRARLAGLDAARQNALELGILQQATKNAEASIRGLLTLAGIRSVAFSTAS